jgi:hypothetical protein
MTIIMNGTMKASLQASLLAILLASKLACRQYGGLAGQLTCMQAGPLSGLLAGFPRMPFLRARVEKASFWHFPRQYGPERSTGETPDSVEAISSLQKCVCAMSCNAGLFGGKLAWGSWGVASVASLA